MSWPLIDLHAHSTASDGSESPAEVVASAHAHGLHTIALTDHDTVAGWDEAASEAARLGVGLVRGVELSAQVFDPERIQPPRSVHLLGYLVDPTHPRLAAEFEKIRSHRDDRLRKMVEAIAEDYPISWEEVAEGMPDGATPGRPHIANVLVAKGLVENVSHAFDHILASHGPYHVPHYAPRLDRALEVIRSAGGVAVLAHPLAAGRHRPDASVASIDRMIQDYLVWKDSGLRGIEVDHRENPEEGREALRVVAHELDLFVTGSSDYHGQAKPNTWAENTTSPETLDALVSESRGVPLLGPSV